MRKVLDVVPAMAPFSVKRLENDMETFFARVNPKERVFMAFNCPNGRCERLFDGQTALFQLASYVASKKGFHLMPDFYAISDSSYQGEHNFWGRDVDSVTKNSKFWEVDYVIIYQDSGTKLSPAWGLAGYEVLSRFSWRDRDSEFRGMRPYDGNAPDWWLIKKS
jgi:hypothetical protein